GKGIINYNILKLVVTAVDNVKEKVKELGIERLKVSTTVSLGFVTGSSFKEVVCGGFALKRDLSNDVSYIASSLLIKVMAGEMMNYVVSLRQGLKVEDKDEKTLFVTCNLLRHDILFYVGIVGEYGIISKGIARFID
nr:hypothetical protein [Tanacetum cinerariifolium]GEY68240.1 hypothetical protein [Tanacetum cinerariifolium]